ncbi:MFS transporter [Pseudomonadales bacterium]|jgi:MFS family permease|nr:MFS transporter [Gammaproteobacteria bacterium]MDB3989767.1 MFS transporter [Pseudomonadales bacterium]MBT3735424.1 MFS transporter [Gammaproteobacteria bacterium]MBT3901145.1 MFS transporter [Gammaproteobacteria bacterium]MDC0894042.1 MFS transporter [Pseudomonadales bacterium]|tara:strand:- start:1436 stop:2719 length:1284 start_codon:yes stop_codon:yes gene_type:complete
MNDSYSPAYRYFVLSVLVLSYVLSFIDRQLMTILLEPIKAEFGASDTAMGFLTGFAFAIFYAVLGIPVARLADRWSRRNVLAISMVIWSAMTAACGMAGSFWQMAVLRVGVGVGEAGGTPPSHSLISSYFPARERSTAMGIYGSGSQIGVLLGMFGGAVIAETMGWRWAFFIFGLPGVLIGLLVFVVVREPPKAPAPVSTSMMSDVMSLWQTPAFAIISFATAFTALAGYGMGTWFPSFLIRIHGLTLTEAGLTLGIVGTLGALIGAVSGGILCDRLTKIDSRWQLRVPSIGAGLSVVFLGLFLIWPESQQWRLGEYRVPVAVVFLFFGGIVSSFWIGPTYAAIQTLTPSHLRSQASALLLLLLNLIGMGLGPLVVGALSDLLAPALGAQSIRYAMLISLVTVLIGSTLYWMGGNQYRNAVDKGDTN